MSARPFHDLMDAIDYCHNDCVDKCLDDPRMTCRVAMARTAIGEFTEELVYGANPGYMVRAQDEPLVPDVSRIEVTTKWLPIVLSKKGEK